MTKLYYSSPTPTFHVYPEKVRGSIVQVTCADLDRCIKTICSLGHYPAVIKDPNNQRQYYINKRKKVRELPMTEEESEGS